MLEKKEFSNGLERTYLDCIWRCIQDDLKRTGEITILPLNTKNLWFAFLNLNPKDKYSEFAIVKNDGSYYFYFDIEIYKSKIVTFFWSNLRHMDKQCINKEKLEERIKETFLEGVH